MTKPLGPYSPILRMGDYLFASGQVGTIGETGVVGDIATQTRDALHKLRELVESASATTDQIAKTTVFLTDMADFSAVNEIYAEFFGDHRPARSCVAVAALPGQAIFEIEAVIYHPESE